MGRGVGIRRPCSWRKGLAPSQSLQEGYEQLVRFERTAVV